MLKNSGSIEKSIGSGSGWPKINGSDQIRILIPEKKNIQNMKFQSRLYPPLTLFPREGRVDDISTPQKKNAGVKMTPRCTSGTPGVVTPPSSFHRNLNKDWILTKNRNRKFFENDRNRNKL